jgi:hypothetical protein
MVVCIYNLSYMGDIGRRITVPGQSKQKVIPYLKNNLKQKELELYLKRYSACLDSSRPRVQVPILKKKAQHHLDMNIY